MVGFILVLGVLIPVPVAVSSTASSWVIDCVIVLLLLLLLVILLLIIVRRGWTAGLNTGCQQVRNKMVKGAMEVC